jgi:hypothetical protein
MTGAQINNPSVPLVVFQAAGFDNNAAVRLKERFDAQDLLLRHVAEGLVTQDILRDEFGIAQLGIERYM